MKQNAIVLKSINQIRRVYGVSNQTVHRWIELGAPIAVLEDGQTKVLLRDLQDWLLEQSRESMRRRLKEEM